MLKRNDIFINWSPWSVVGSIVLSKVWFEYGLLSNQIRANDIRNVVLLVVVSSSIHHYIFRVWPILSPCTHNGRIPVIWKFWWVVVEPISNILSPPWFVLNIQLVLETCVSIFFMSRLWSLCLDEISDFLEFMCIWCKLPWWVRERLVLLFLESSQVSHACAKYSVVW